MFHLTPQEKTAVAALLTVCLLGSLISWMLNHDLRPIQWAKVSAQRIQYPPVDINTSTAQELERLPGIGLKTAERIVQLRIEHGAFASLEELRKVKGITKKSFQKIQTYYQSIGQKHD